MVFSHSIQAAASVLKSGGIIAYPTETVYGLGCLPHDIIAIKRLLLIKQRMPEKGLILIGASQQQLEPFTARLDNRQWQTIATLRERTTTWIVPAAEPVSPWIRGEHPTIAIRITRHKLARALCLASHGAIISTSANPGGEPPVREACKLAPRLVRRLDLILESECGPDQLPSQLRDLITGTLMRE